jgi:outer membrane receptor for ferrienterochelin and colicin
MKSLHSGSTEARRTLPLYATGLGLLIASPAFGVDRSPAPLASGSYAATARAPSVTNEANDLNLEEIIVTGIPGNASSKFDSSLSVSTLSPEEILQSDPSSAADIVRNIPGFRAQASGGEGNANISARGLPMRGGS